VKQEVRSILRQYRISITKPRMAMLEVFLRSNEALTYDYFLTNTSPQLNRVTIFRVLNLFTNKNIIDRIPVTDNISRYLLHKASTSAHSNFMCSKCKKIIPLETIIPPKVKLPDGCVQQNIQIIIGGLCNSCKYKK
jgi:Fur family ferric uptake transcriptional regulator